MKRVYTELSGDPTDLTPKDIFNIAEGLRPGNREAAAEAFAQLGEMAGDAIAAAITVVDGIVVIGGGLTGAAKYILPALLKELRATTEMMNGSQFGRLQMRAFNLDDEAEFTRFAQGEAIRIPILGTDRTTDYDPSKRMGVLISKLGASRSIAMGAYVYALNHLT